MVQKTITLRPPSPFRLDLTVWVLRRLPTNAMDRWDGTTYTRVMVLGDRILQADVRQTGPVDQPEIEVALNRARGGSTLVPAFIPLLERLLGLNVDLGAFYRRALKDKEFGPIARRFLGFRPPRFPSAFEAAVNGISCQQLSLNVGIHLLNRLSERYGRALGSHHAFPTPQELASARSGDIRDLGYSSGKTRYILGISRAISEGRLDLEGLAGRNDQEAMETLLKIPGVGRWTAEYIMLRGLGRLNTLPAGDLGIQNNLKRRLDLDHRPNADEVRSMLSRWSPYTGLMYFYFLMDWLQERGVL